MTQEEKELLFKDLCARLPYGVKVCYTSNDMSKVLELIGMPNVWDLIGLPALYLADIVIYGKYRFAAGDIEESIRPYLRSIHKLTKEELEELEFLTDSDYVDYCNKHHIDYRNLIPKDLALEAPEGIYKEVQQ